MYDNGREHFGYDWSYMLETLPPPTERIRSKGSLWAQSWICGILVFPAMIAGLLSVTGWMTLAMSQIDPVVPSVPDGRHDVLVLALWTSPGILLGPLLYFMIHRSWKLMDEHHRTLVCGEVTDLVLYTYREYAVVTGQNRAGVTITDKIAVPITIVPTLKVGDPYPWQ